MISPAVGVTFFSLQAVLQGVALLLIPKLWKPEMPFGVTVPAGEGRERVDNARAYWTRTIIVLTVVSLCFIFAVAASSHRMFFVKTSPLWQIIYFVLAYAFFGRARRIVLPLSAPATTVIASMRRRRYRDYMNPLWEGVPLLMMISGAAIGLGAGHDGLSALQRRGAAYLCQTPIMYLLCLIFALAIPRSRQSLGGGDPDVALAASDALRRAWVRLLFACRTAFAALALLLGILAAAPARESSLWPIVRIASLGSLALMVIGFAALPLLYGQGGWRWAVRKGLVAPDEVPAVMDGDGMQDRHWKLGIFYYNPQDPSFLVEQRVGVGWTFNFANVWAVIGLFAVIGVPILLASVTALAGSVLRR